jgi:hypothetical protein
LRGQQQPQVPPQPIPLPPTIPNTQPSAPPVMAAPQMQPVPAPAPAALQDAVNASMGMPPQPQPQPAPAPAPAPQPVQQPAAAWTPGSVDFVGMMQHLGPKFQQYGSDNLPILHADRLAQVAAEVGQAFNVQLNAFTDIQQSQQMVDYAIQIFQRDGIW